MRHNLSKEEKDQYSQLDPDVLIPLVEGLAAQEKLTLEANKILNNELEYLENDFRLTHIKLLLNRLHRHSGHLSP